MATDEGDGDDGVALSVDEARTAVLSYLSWKMRRTLATNELESLNSRLDALLTAYKRELNE